MSDHKWYSQENNHNHRELTIVNAALLVGKAPTKEKRIRVKVRMILSGQPVTGAPDWLSAGEAHVSTWHDPVNPTVTFRGYDLHFSAQNLFDSEGVKAPRCLMKSFEIHECGDSEAPDIAVSFCLYIPFSTAVWQWLGQFGGESCWCAFTPGVPAEASQGSTESAEEQEIDSEEDEDEEDAPEGTEDEESEYDPDAGEVIEMPTGKSDAKNLAAYHEKVLDSEQKRGRGRPRKNPVDPLSVNAATAF